jgi:2,4-dienoyl-CoA reductase-like NADH-dependent reductase (Old Yellow Enzyme family)
MPSPRSTRCRGSASRGLATGPCWATCSAGSRGRRSSRSRIVYEVAQVVDIPIVAIGGITELGDALDFFAVGAVAVQVGTAIFADPALPVRLADELTVECRRRGLASYRTLVGTALPSRAGPPSAKGVEYRP